MVEMDPERPHLHEHHQPRCDDQFEKGKLYDIFISPAD
jgi:hypothetical protein